MICRASFLSRRRRVASVLSAIFVSLAAASARAEETYESDFYRRCHADQLDKNQAWQRCAWAHKCGYISADDLAYFNRTEKYPVFSNPGAAVHEHAPCYGVGTVVEVLGDCKVRGCYLPDQELMFGGKYVSIAVAHQQKLPTVSAVGSTDSYSDGQVVEQRIEAFVAGEETGAVLRIAVASGKSLTVTTAHPLIDENGVVLTADAIVPGQTTLLTTDGPSRVIDVARMPYDGMVWNLQPESLEVADNVLFAQGFLTGSVRFQNEWADDQSRLRIRDHVDLAMFTDCRAALGNSQP